MRRTAFISIVPVSLALLACAAARPRYGGTLRVETRAQIRDLDPAISPDDSLDRAAKSNLLSQVFETLVRLDEKGRPQPLLADSWSHDEAQRRWVFRVRPRVVFHDGAPWAPPNGVVTVSDDRPIEQILRDLSLLKNAVVLRAVDGSILGTGPFKVERFEPGKMLLLAAHEQHWAGRPFLDAVEVRMGRNFHDQAQDAQTGQEDVTELPVTEVRRARQRGDVVALSAPLETLVLRWNGARPPSPTLPEALSLAVDRASIQSVLLQKMGEVSAALLPQWLSGHAIAFPVDRDPARARQLASAPVTLGLDYDRQDAILRAVAERIALNAAECDITLQIGPLPGVRLAWLRVISPDPDLALDEIGATPATGPDHKADPFERESALLSSAFVASLAQVPVAHALSPRVQGWLGARWVATDRWDLAGLWLGDVAQ